MFYKSLLFFAYLRPKETQFANTRLFFGVYRETLTGKSKSGYNLKVAHTVFVFSRKEDTYPGLKQWSLCRNQFLLNF